MEKPVSILIVEDDTNTLEVLALALTHFGFQCTSACHGLEGLKLYSANPTDLVITDFQMPGMNGTDLIAELRKLNPDIPAILATASHSDEVLLEALNLHRVIPIKKPMDIDTLLGAINAVREIPAIPYQPRRRHFRVPSELEIIIEKLGKGILKNISLGGGFITTEHPLQAGTRLSFSIPITIPYEGHVRIESCIVKHSGPTGSGVWFEKIEPSQEAGLRSLIVDQLRRSGLGWFEAQL